MDPDRDQTSYACGDQIAGKYQLLRPIGQGGMGVVWVAHNLVLDVHVAVKLIRGSIAGPGAAARLLREARSAARIAHPGVVRVFDHGTTDRGDPFIVMELLEGETLRHLLTREQRLSPLRAAAFFLPVADALAALADASIVHRDLKPENIVLTPRDPGLDLPARTSSHDVRRFTPKLVDFGVAFLPDMDRLTWAGLMVGTPDYLAPEQADGVEVDARADVWAFSVMLFEAILGDRPFDGESIAELIANILEQPTPRLSEYGACDEELSSIVARGLEKDREDRWPSMREMGAALSAWAVARGLTEDVSGTAIRAPASSEFASSLRDGTERPSLTSAPTGERQSPRVRIGSPLPPVGDRAKTEVALTRRKRQSGMPVPAKPTRLLPEWSDRPPADATTSRVSAPAPTSNIPAPIEAPAPLAPAPSRWPRRALFAFAALLLAAAFVFASLRRPGRDPASLQPLSPSSSPVAAPAPSPSLPITPSATPLPSAPSASSPPALSATTAPSSARTTAPLPTSKSPSRRIDDLKDPYRPR